MPSHVDGPLATYQRLRTSGLAEAALFRHEQALDTFSRALGVAESIRDQRLRDTAYCNWAGLKIETGTGDEVLTHLRTLLLRSGDPITRRLAAYHIARAHELRGEYSKGLAYARLGWSNLGRSESRDPTAMASSYNQIANFLFAESRFDEALTHYELAIAIEPSRQAHRLATFRHNAGACHLMLGRSLRAASLLVSALRTYRRLSPGPAQALCHLDLANAFIELARPLAAVLHAEQALAFARLHGETPAVKSALFVLGEAWRLEGDEGRARGYFDQLSAFYPDLPFIADLLLTVEVRQMINLSL